MNLDALTPEQLAGLIVAFGTGTAAIIASIAYLIRSFAKANVLNAQTKQTVAVHDAEREKMETETDRDVTKTITGELVQSNSENRELQRQLRDCEVNSKEKDGIIKELRAMNTSLGERNGVQAKLLMDAAKEMDALRGIEEFQRNKITAYEIQFADKINKDKDT